MAVFILLSMFLAVLGEGQQAVRAADEGRAKGTVVAPIADVLARLLACLTSARSRLTEARKSKYHNGGDEGDRQAEHDPAESEHDPPEAEPHKTELTTDSGAHADRAAPGTDLLLMEMQSMARQQAEILKEIAELKRVVYKHVVLPEPKSEAVTEGARVSPMSHARTCACVHEQGRPGDVSSVSDEEGKWI
eukprot:7391030-Prymnesium_polylepis.3